MCDKKMKTTVTAKHTKGMTKNIFSHFDLTASVTVFYNLKFMIQITQCPLV